MSRLKIGLVGCGHIGAMVHLATLRSLPNARVTSLADTDPVRLEMARSQFPGAQLFSDYRELLSQADIEAVVICLPNALHAEAAILALEQGKHVYLEKPLAIDLNQGLRVLEAWRRSGRVGIIGFNYRWNPLHQELRRQLQSGRIGQLIGARSVWTTPPHRTPDWKTSRQSGGGVLLDLASHHFDLIQFWFDQPVVEVQASVRAQRFEGDTATVQLRLADGLPVQSFFSLNSIDDDRFEVYGRAGKLSLDRFNSWKIARTDLRTQSILRRYFGRAISSLPYARFAVAKLRAPHCEPSFATALGEFVAAAQTGRQIQPDFEDAFRSLATVVAAEESARTGRPVRMDLEPNLSLGKAAS